MPWSRSRTAGHGSWLPGLKTSFTFCRRRATLFWDGLAPRSRRPFFPWRCGPKVKTFPLSFLELGLRFLQGQPLAGHHLSRPLSGLRRLSPREDHEVVRGVDDLRLQDLSPFGDPPILQETIPVQVGSASLRRTLSKTRFV